MPTTPRKSDKWIPWYFVAFFIGLAIIDGIFVYIAMSTHTGVTTEHAYQKGLAYNNVLEQSAAQEKRHWNIDITFEGNTLRVTAQDQYENPLRSANAAVYISRPTVSGHDFKQALLESSPGVYTTPITFPLPGQWDVKASLIWDTQHHQTRKRIIVP